MAEHGGAAGGSGYGFQSNAIAYVGCHILTGEPLHWFDDPIDIPVAVRTETGGPGDDLLVELANGREIEVQAKAGLSRGDDFWGALTRLIKGLKANRQLLGVLLVDDRASGTIRSNLAIDLEKLRGGTNVSPDQRDSITNEFILRASLDLQRDRDVLQRLRVIALHIEPGQPNRLVALTHLRTVLERGEQAESALEMLTARSLRLIKLRGRMDIASLQLRLRKRYPLTISGESPSAVRKRFLDWQAARMATFGVPGFVRHELLMARDWIPRKVIARVPSGEVQEPETVESLLTTRGRDIHMLASGPGDGKSTIGKRLTFWLAERNRMVIHVRLRQVALKVAAGMSFSEAIRITATDGIDISAAHWEMLLAEPFLFVADGIDECGTHIGDITEGIKTWQLGHKNASLIVTGRAAGLDSIATANLTRYDIAPFNDADQASFVETLARVVGSTVEVDKVNTAVKAAFADKRLSPFRTPSPLILAFVARLVFDGINPGHRRTELFDKLAKRLLNDQPHDSRPEPELEPVFRRWGYRAAGWNLLVGEPKDKEALEGMMAAAVSHERGVERSRIAQRCLSVLEARGLLEPIGDSWTFVHEALAEHAAALWLMNDLDATDRSTWVKANATDERFRQVFLFAAGEASAKNLVENVLAAWDRADAASTVPVLAALMIAEMTDPKIEALKQVLSELISRLQLPIATLTEESADALRALATVLPSEVAAAVHPLHASSNSQARWNAMAICLECGPSFVDRASLVDVLSEFDTSSSSAFELPAASVKTSENPLRARSRGVSLSFLSRGWDRQQTFVKQAIDVLLAGDSSEATVKLVLQVAKGKGVSVNTLDHIAKCLDAKGLSDAAIELTAGLAKWAPDYMRFVFRPREEDLDLLLVFREACGDVQSEPMLAGSWDKLHETGKLIRYFEWEKESIGSYAFKLNRNGFVTVARAVLQASVIRVARLAGELDWAIAEQRSRLEQPDQPTFGGIYSSLGGRPQKLDWTKVKLSPEDRSPIAGAIRHPSLPVRIMAVHAIEGGVLADQAGELCRTEIMTGDGIASIAAFISESVLGYCPIRLLCDIVPEDISEEWRPLFAAIEQLDDSQFDGKLTDVLLRAIHSVSGIAAAAARSLLKCDAAKVASHVADIRKVFDGWKEHDDTQPNRVVPNSPRPELVDLLWKLGALQPADLLELAEDHRSDVRVRAVQHLGQHLALQPKLAGAFVVENRNNSGLGPVITELSRIAPTSLREIGSTLLAMANNAHPEVQAAILPQLPILKPPSDQATAIIHAACGSGDPVIQAAAVKAARVLHIAIPLNVIVGSS